MVSKSPPQVRKKAPKGLRAIVSFCINISTLTRPAADSAMSVVSSPATRPFYRHRKLVGLARNMGHVGCALTAVYC